MLPSMKLALLGLLVGTAILLLLGKKWSSLLESLRFTSFLSVDTGTDADASCLSEDEYLNRRYFSLRNDVISYDVRETDYEEQLEGESVNEHRHCNRTRLVISKLKKEDFVRRLDSLSLRRNRRPMHIAFIGDSTVRQHFLSFIEWIPNYDKKISQISTRYAEYKFHEDRNITIPLLDNLTISFYWRNLIQADLIDDFQRWSSTENHNLAPDFILLGITVHHIIRNNITDNLHEFEKLFTLTLLPLINASVTLHPQQEIIWLLQSPTMGYMGPGAENMNYGIDPGKIMNYNQVIRRIFKGTRVWIWDSFGVVVEEYLRTCALTRFQREDKFLYTNCKDFIHPGLRAISIGSELIINHIFDRSSLKTRYPIF